MDRECGVQCGAREHPRSSLMGEEQAGCQAEVEASDELCATASSGQDEQRGRRVGGDHKREPDDEARGTGQVGEALDVTVVAAA